MNIETKISNIFESSLLRDLLGMLSILIEENHPKEQVQKYMNCAKHAYFKLEDQIIQEMR